MFARRSGDDGKSWSAPVSTMPEEGYMGTNNDRFVQTRSGRVLLPMFRCIGPDYHSQASVFGSDDDGRSWRRLTPYLDLPGVTGASEPGIVECADGSLFMWMRTDKQRIYYSRSRDNGETWSEPQPTDLVAPISPASAARLPNSSNILMIYNDRRACPPVAGDVAWNSQFNWRTPLVSAISSDNGATWHSHKLVEADESKSYCYVSMTFHKQNTILTYYQGLPGGPNLVDMKLKIVPTAAWTAVHG
jgi:predicted neuraminidase